MGGIRYNQVMIVLEILRRQECRSPRAGLKNQIASGIDRVLFSFWDMLGGCSLTGWYLL